MNNKYKILLVEDDSHIVTLITALMESEGYSVLLAGNAEEGRLMYYSHLPDIVLLDLGLPDRDGLCFLEELRKKELTPVIVISARNEEETKVRALDIGANDYVTKPFGSAELLARIRSTIRNCRFGSKEGHMPGGKFVFRDLEIDYDRRSVMMKKKDIHLTQTEYNILAYLSGECGKLLTYSKIIKAVWGASDEGSVKKLQVNMANLRRKLGISPGESTYIVNEIGVGYRMQERIKEETL